MAVFARQDANIPILTQIYQLEWKEGDYDEIRHFLWNTPSLTALPPIYRSFTDESMAKVAEACDLAKQIMRALYYERRVHLDLVKRFDSLYQANRGEMHYEGGADEDGYIRAGQVVKAIHPTIVAPGLHDIVGEIAALLTENYRLLAECPECRNVFVRARNRPDAAMCSQRCRIRSSQRKRKTVCHAQYQT